MEQLNLIQSIYKLPSKDNLIKHQKQDPQIQKWAKIAQDEKKPTNFPFFLREGLMMRRTNKPHLFKKNRKAFEVVEKICIPISTNNWIRKIFLYSVHGLPLSGHDGIKRTIYGQKKNIYGQK
jgi:hypothetical protein